MYDFVTVLIPVGPSHNKEWLKEAIDSVLEDQTQHPDEIFLLDDSNNTLFSSPINAYRSGGPEEISRLFNIPLLENGDADMWYSQLQCRDNSRFVFVKEDWPYITYWQSPCNLGFSVAFNCGVALSQGNLIIYLASDDKLMPTAIEEMVNCWLEHDQKDAFYSCSYDINGETHTIPNNLGMITRNLWLWYKGYPPAAFVGPDAAMHSVLMKHAPERRIWVKDGTPLYWVRDHDNTETKTHTWKYVDEMNSIRRKLTDNFIPQEGIVLK